MSVFVVPVDASDGTEHQEAEVTNQEVTLGRSFLVFSVRILPRNVSYQNNYLLFILIAVRRQPNLA